MSSSINQTNLRGRNVCLDTRVNLQTDQIEDKDDAEATPKELHKLVDRHERRSQPNVGSPLEVNLMMDMEPRILMVILKLERTKTPVDSLVKKDDDVFSRSYADMPGLDIIVLFHR